MKKAARSILSILLTASIALSPALSTYALDDAGEQPAVTEEIVQDAGEQTAPQEPVVQEIPADVSGDPQGGDAGVIVEPAPGGDVIDAGGSGAAEINDPNEVPASGSEGAGTGTQDGSNAAPASGEIPVPGTDDAQNIPAAGMEGTGSTENPEEIVQTEEVNKEEAKDDEKEDEDADAPKMPAFEESAEIDGIEVVVKAPEGAFPEGARLSVEKVPAEQQAEADKALDDARGEGQEVAVSYTYDIKVLDASGQEIHPANGQKVEVAFTLEEVTNTELEAGIYHITKNETTGQLTAAKLNAVVDEKEKTVKAETDGFSLYTLEFTYKDQKVNEPSASVEVNAISRTNNIVGDIFVNWVNGIDEELQEQSLIDYPLDPHDLSWYGDSPRVRMLEGGDPANPNYLVYRDSYLLVSEEQSKQYTVTVSEDGTIAYITPAIPAEELQGKTGIVFLAESVGYDNILVFDGEPSYDGDTVSIPIRKVDDITVNMLFSDGKLEVATGTEAPSGNRKKANNLRGANLQYVRWEFSPKRDGYWSAEIDPLSVSAEWPTAGVNVDVWDLLFEMKLRVIFGLDFTLTTTGKPTNGRQTERIAGVSIPIELFDLSLDYNLQVEFDDTPLELEGTLRTEFDYTLGTHGANVRDFQSPVEIKKLKVINESDYNKPFSFYIGTQLAIEGGFLKLDVDLGFMDVTLGPVLSLKQDSHGGRYFTGIYEKDLIKIKEPAEGDDDRYMYKDNDGNLAFINRSNAPNEIHTCTVEDEEGCLSLHARETQRNEISFKINLYFKKWKLSLSDTKEILVGEKDYYNSYTYESGMKEGFCPHRLYKVPVAVWEKEVNGTPVPNMNVTVNDSLDLPADEIELFAKDVTGTDGESKGKAVLFLPYGQYLWYTYMAGGQYGGVNVAGSARDMIRRPENEQVDIIISSEDKVTVNVNIDWVVDYEDKDIPNYSYAYESIVLERKAGGSGEWEPYRTWEYIPADEGWQRSITGLDKYGFDESGQAVLYNYRVRVWDRESAYNDSYNGMLVVPEGGYVVHKHASYANAVGTAEPDGDTEYLVNYSETEKENGDLDVTIRETAVMEIKMNKQWLLSDPDSKPDHVYLALLQKPYYRWEGKAGEKNVPLDWVTVLNPIEGAPSSIGTLIDENILKTYDDLSAISNRPLAIGKVSDANGWSITYTVPKYRNGIKMDYRAAELDSSVIKTILTKEYGLNYVVEVSSFGNYISIPGDAYTTGQDWMRTAAVINMDEDPNTLVGTVRWQDYAPIPSDLEVKIHVYKDTDENEEQIGAINLKASDYQDRTWIWTLFVEEGIDPDAVYYVEEEEFVSPNGEEKNWLPDIQGLDVFNHYVIYPSIQVLIRAVFEEGIDQENLILEKNGTPVGDELLVRLKDKETGAIIPYLNNVPDIPLDRSEDWFGRTVIDREKIKPIGSYTVEAPEIRGLYAILQEPFMGTWYGNLAYYYTVYYVPREQVKLQITKEWDNLDPSAMGPESDPYSGAYPKEISIDIYRDKDLIATRKLEEVSPYIPGTSGGTNASDGEDETGNGESAPQTEGTDPVNGENESEEEDPVPPEWSVITIDEDDQGQPLYRYSDSGEKYVYSIKETPIDGFSSKVIREDEVSDTGNILSLTLRNTWVGPDYVNVKGTIFWKGDEGKEELRPETVTLSVINANENSVRIIEVPVTIADDEENEDDDEDEYNGKCTWEAKYLPGKDAEGNLLRYSVLEDHIFGYTTTYDEPTFDEETNEWSNFDEDSRTWTCDLTNTLTGYYKMTIKKEIEGDPGDSKETFKFQIKPKIIAGEEVDDTEEEGEDTSGDNADTEDDEVVLQEIRTPAPSIEGSGETEAEFIIDREGLYLYTFSEEKGENEKCTYDTKEKLVLINRYTDDDGNPAFRSWVQGASKKKEDSGSGDSSEEGGSSGSGDASEDEEDDWEIPNWEDFSDVDTEDLDKLESDTVTFTNIYPEIKIKKTWDADLENKDHPASIEVVVQKKNDDGKWESVKLVELKDDNDWEASVVLSDDSGDDEDDADGDGKKGDSQKTEYRVRELREEVWYEELVGKVKKMISGEVAGGYDGIVGAIKESDVYGMLPENIQNAMNQGSDKLKEELNATTENLYDKLVEKLGLVSADKRIIYNKDDSDKGKDDPNRVTYHVPKYTSLISGEVDDHTTMYKVSYGKDSGKDGAPDTYTIKNTAILEIDLIKRWIKFGMNSEGLKVALNDDDTPDSAWVVLMFSLKADITNNDTVSGLADKMNIDLGPLSSLSDYEFPVFNLGPLGEETPFLLEEGRDPISIISDLALGIDLDWFSSVVPLRIAIAKVEGNDDEDDDKGEDDDNEGDSGWREHYVVSKYALGLPVEFKGAELSSEIIRQIIKYVFHFDPKISYNPFDNYISIPTKAVPTIMGLTDINQLLDFGTIAKKLLETAKSLTLKDIQSLGWDDFWDPLLDKENLMANAINIKIDIDLDFDNTISGSKIWKVQRAEGEKEEEYTSKVAYEKANRPTFLKIHIKDGADGIEELNKAKVKLLNSTSDTEEVTIEFRKYDDGSTDSWFVLNKSDFGDQDEWKWELDLDQEIEEDGNSSNGGDDDEDKPKIDPSDLTVTEEYPEDYSDEYKNHYTCETDEFDLINTWDAQTIRISGKKIWKDEDDRDGLRPDTLKIYLLANTGENGAFERIKVPENETTDPTTGTGTGTEGNTGTETGTGTEGNTGTGTGTGTEGNTGTGTGTGTEGNTGTGTGTGTGTEPAEEKEEYICVETSKAGDWKYFFPEQPTKDENGNPITYSVEEEWPEGDDNFKEYNIENPEANPDHKAAVDGYNLINTHEPEKTTIRGVKTWEDEDDKDGIRPDSITVWLMDNGKGVRKTTVSEDENGEWKYCFEDVPKNEGGKEIEYSVKEEDVEGYTPEYTVEEVSEEENGTDETGGETNVPGTDEAGGETNDPDADEGDTGNEDTETEPEKSYNIKNIHKPGTITVSGTKVWVDTVTDEQSGITQKGKHPKSITIRLKANGEEVDSITVTKEDGWKWSFNDLPKTDEAGKEIEYSISEDVITDYTSEITENADSEEPIGEDPNGNDPNGEEPNSDDPNGEDPETEAVTEIKSYTVTNTYSPDKTQVDVTKVWDDGDDQDGIRPETVTVNLLADNEQVKGTDGSPLTLELSEKNKWTGSFKDLPATKKVPKETAADEPQTDAPEGTDENPSGEPEEPEEEEVPIEYTVEEEKAGVITGENKEGEYAIEISGDVEKGFTVTNIHTPDTLTVEVTKAWDDNDDQDGKRPESVTIKLLADKEEIDSKTVTEEDDWKCTFENLPKRKDGNEIEYTVEEEETDVITGKDAAGTYAHEVTEDEKGFTVTNTHTPETITIEGEKTWEDEKDRDGKRPENITIRLKADGEETQTAEVTEKDEWKWSFKDLPKYKEGKEIEYTISEDNIDAYTSEIDEYNVTNTYTPGKTQVNVTKIWKDEEDQDGIRPNSVNVRLLADGKDTGEKQTLSEGNSWSASFADLDVMEGGKEIKYTVEEETTDVITGADGKDTYAFEVTGDVEKGFTVTNKHTPEKITIEGKKVWEDDNDQDNKRPDTITIRLKADGKEIDSKTVSEKEEWKWSFADLPKNADGKEITYTISEDVVREYTAEVSGDAESGFTVTNTYTPGKTQVNVSKVWKDKEDQDGIRPESVTIALLADGEETGKTLKLSEDNNWTGSFTELIAQKDEEDVEYTIEETLTDVITGTDADGTYADDISGDAVKGFTVTNTHTPQTVDVSGTKVWADQNDQAGKRPESITIRLKADGKEVESKTVTEEDGWAWTFRKLPKNAGGKSITYTVSEDIIPDYTSTISGDTVKGFTVRNTYTPGKTQVNVTKVWDDEDDKEQIRPESVTVNLLADGEKAKDANGRAVKAVLSKANGWANSFTGLDRMKDGKEIRYTVEEVYTDVITGVNGPGTYAAAVSGTAEKGYTITNTHTSVPEPVDVKVVKVWDDGDDQDGKRPDSITIRLLDSDKKEVGSRAITEADGWKWTFTDLQKYADGKEIVYSISEDKVSNYSSEISGTVEEGFTVTNTCTPGKTQVNVTKVWKDGDDADGIRPESVTVKLLANGKDTRKTVTLSEANGWTDAFRDLDEMKKGSVIEYTVEEEKTKDITGEDTASTYADKVTGSADTVFVITNTHTPVPKYKITYKLNGGTYNGSTEDIVEIYPADTTISIHEKPTRTGYTFDYWEGSKYQPGDKYVVKGDHVFIARWKKDTKPSVTPVATVTPIPGVPRYPVGTNSTNSTAMNAKTGDNSHMGMWLAVLALAIAGLAAGVAVQKKRRR